MIKSTVTPERLHALNHGTAQAQNLMESLAIDFDSLLHHVVPGFIMPPLDPSLGITKYMIHRAAALLDQYGFSLHETLRDHPSDTIRGLTCYMIGLHSLSLSEKLTRIRPLANDPHFGVREWAWLALRPSIIDQVDDALLLLTPWTHDPSERIRRFASEITRPRGVWCSHIKQLKKEPWHALSLLEPLKADHATYVQLSVANWLNDASKDHPAWVQDLCSQWQQTSDLSATHKICKRALRTIRKKSHRQQHSN